MIWVHFDAKLLKLRQPNMFFTLCMFSFFIKQLQFSRKEVFFWTLSTIANNYDFCIFAKRKI